MFRFPGTCLAGLTRRPLLVQSLQVQTLKLGANLPSSSAFSVQTLQNQLSASVFFRKTDRCSRTARQIKNPASSAGPNRHTGGFARCSISFYPVLVENPTIGSTSRLLLFSRWEDFLRSDCDAPERPAALPSSRTICNDTSFSPFVKPP